MAENIAVTYTNGADITETTTNYTTGVTLSGTASNTATLGGLLGGYNTNTFNCDYWCGQSPYYPGQHWWYNTYGVSYLKANILDEKNKYVIELDTPGIKGKDINATITNKVLTVVVNFGSRAGTGDRLSGDQTRYFFLPDDVKPTSCEATLEDGVLSLSFSKSDKPKTHRIEIK
jgi:HSP20 family protein